jgi:DNA-binding NarL/FixJ family response regulator
MKARILLVDDHQVVRDGLRFTIRHQRDMEVAGEAGDPQTALSLFRTLSPDLTVLDVHLGAEDGIELASQMITERPQAKVLVLSAYPDQALVNRAVRAGVKGYLLKANASDDLIHAIRAVLGGSVHFCQEVMAAVVTDYRKLLSANQAPPADGLSNRERQLLVLIAGGRRNKEIAMDLDLTVKSVETYRSHLMKKLGCGSPAELVRYAIREGLAKP